MSVQEPSNRDSLNVLSGVDQQGDTESLDHARLSVCKEVEPTQTPKNRQTGFGGDRPDYENLEFNSGEPIRATVEKDDTRKLKTCADAVDAFEDYLDAKEDQVLVLEDQLNGDVPCTSARTPLDGKVS